MEKENVIKLIERCSETNLLWMVLGSLISDDNSLETKKDNLRISREMLGVVNEANIDEKVKLKVKEYLNNTINVLEKEV